MRRKMRGMRQFFILLMTVALFLFGLGLIRAPSDNFSTVDFYGQAVLLMAGMLMITTSLYLGTYCVNGKWANWRSFLLILFSVFSFVMSLSYSLDFWKSFFGSGISFEQIRQQFWQILVTSLLIALSFFLFGKSLEKHQ